MAQGAIKAYPILPRMGPSCPMISSPLRQRYHETMEASAGQLELRYAMAGARMLLRVGLSRERRET